MYRLKTNTAVRIAVGPLVDPTDGKTAKTALTVTDLSVQLYQIKTDGDAVVRTQFAPTASGGNNDMALVASSTDGMYDLELTAAQLNWLGNGRISFYDLDGFLVHWIDIQVVSAAYFDWIYGTATTGGVTFGGFLRKATAVDVLIGPFGAAGLTIDVEISKNGQALANKHDDTVPQHDAAGDIDGYYNCELDATDTDTVGLLTLVCYTAGKGPCRFDYQVLNEKSFDEMFGTTLNVQEQASIT